MDALLEQTLNSIPRILVYEMGGYDTYTSCYVVQFGHIQAEFEGDPFPNRIGNIYLRANGGLPDLDGQQALYVAARQSPRRLVVPEDAYDLSEGLGYGLEEAVIPSEAAIGPETFASCKGLRKLWFTGLRNQFASHAFQQQRDLVFYCYADSDAARYASARRMPIVTLRD